MFQLSEETFRRNRSFLKCRVFVNHWDIEQTIFALLVKIFWRSSWNCILGAQRLFLRKKNPVNQRGECYYKEMPEVFRAQQKTSEEAVLVFLNGFWTIQWSKRGKVITNNCRKSFVHNKTTSEEAVLVFLKGLGCQDICALGASRFFFRSMASYGDRSFRSGDLLLFVSTCLYLANTALASTEKIPRRISEISIWHWIPTVQI